jgi:hypothetical protein
MSRGQPASRVIRLSPESSTVVAAIPQIASESRRNTQFRAEGESDRGQEIPASGGFAMATSRVIKIDPHTLNVRELIRYPYNDAFNVSTVAIQIGKELWVGSVRGDRIARFPAP